MYRKVILLVLALTAVFCGSSYAERNVMVPVQEYYGTGSINKYDKFSMTFEDGVIEEERGEEDPVYHVRGYIKDKIAHTAGKEFLAPVSFVKDYYEQIRFSFDIKVVGDEMGIAARCRQYTDKNFSGTASAFSPLNIPAGDLSDGAWHSVAVEFCIDGTSGAYTAYLDDMEEPYATGTTTPGYGLDFIRMQPVCASDVNLDYYVDNIVFSRQVAVPELLDVNNGDDVSYDATEISANLDGALGMVAPENVVISSVFGETKVSEVTVSRNSLSITLAEPLESGTEYTLTLLPETKTQDGTAIVEAQDVTFSTTVRDLDITDASLTVDTTLQFSGTLIDESSSISARVIVVLYDAEGRIQQVKIGDEVKAGAIGAEVPVSEDNTAKIFCVTSDFQNVIGEKIFAYIGGQN